ncbi:MAG: hypothetical protein R3309_08930, partial [Reinekea sp.]|nr:hypothetical protein [Reinekea sp.]
EESVWHGSTPKRATKGGLKSINSEAPMGFDSILTTSPLVKAGSRGSPLGKKTTNHEHGRESSPLISARTRECVFTGFREQILAVIFFTAKTYLPFQ